MSRRVLALVLACAAALTGCAAIPTTGPINTGSPVLIDPGQPIPLISEPLQDGSPEQIVYGFLAASAAGLADQYAGARRYLTTAAAATWSPTASVLIYPSTAQPSVEKRDDGTVLVEVPVQGSLDATGVYTEAPPAAPGELAMGLVKNADGQWRISSLDDGVVMSAADFNAYYRQMAVYFASANGSYLVPDVRWFPCQRDSDLRGARPPRGPVPVAARRGPFGCAGGHQARPGWRGGVQRQGGHRRPLGGRLRRERQAAQPADRPAGGDSRTVAGSRDLGRQGHGGRRRAVAVHDGRRVDPRPSARHRAVPDRRPPAPGAQGRQGQAGAVHGRAPGRGARRGTVDGRQAPGGDGPRQRC